MKHCYKWMAACVVMALAVAFVLPRIGVPFAGLALLAPLLMIACCVLPMLFMLKAGQDGKKGSCCVKESEASESSKGVQDKANSSAARCH